MRANIKEGQLLDCAILVEDEVVGLESALGILAGQGVNYGSQHVFGIYS